MKGIIICVLSVLFINMAFASPKDAYTVEELKINQGLDETFERLNKGLPKEVAPNMTADRVYRKDKKVYFIFTRTIQSSNPAGSKELGRLLQENIAPKFCLSTEHKNMISLGYSFITVYNSFDKKEAHRIVVDKDTCAKYW